MLKGPEGGKLVAEDQLVRPSWWSRWEAAHPAQSESLGKGRWLHPLPRKWDCVGGGVI